jgi:hypothetical protein
MRSQTNGSALLHEILNEDWRVLASESWQAFTSRSISDNVRLLQAAVADHYVFLLVLSTIAMLILVVAPSCSKQILALKQDIKKQTFDNAVGIAR